MISVSDTVFVEIIGY